MIRLDRTYISFGVLTITALLSRPLIAVEEPPYEMIDEIGELEIRRYRPSIIARTRVGGTFDDVGNQGFKRLAAYIFGGNEAGEKIAMTAPVGMMPSGEPQHINQYWITFNMPAAYKMNQLPTPKDPRVEIVRTSEKFVAVVRYKGNWSEKKYRLHESKLLELLDQSPAWARSGEVTWARYSPPFLPGFMKTNEVSIEVTQTRGDVE
jgi:hypothetical protein